MSLFTIGDLHLSLSSDKPMDVFGSDWIGYVKRLSDGFNNVGDDDTVVLLGDLSWGMNFEQSVEDFKFIGQLPGKKIVVKGNHDYWWSTVKKMHNQLAEINVDNIRFLHNNSYAYNEFALCGTRGWFEDKTGSQKVFLRELGRLRASLLDGCKHNPSKLICFLHYPPIYEDYCCNEIIDILNEFNVKQCYYAHLHGYGRRQAYEGDYKGISYRLVSADHILFNPLKIL